jgi:hypothetical protein
LDVVTLTTQKLPENTLEHAVAGDLLIYAVGDKLIARDLRTNEVRWSSPIPDRVSFPEFIAASEDCVFVVGNPDGIAGYSLASGKRLFDEALPKTTGPYAANNPVTSAAGIAFSKGDDAVVFVTNDGRVVSLAPPVAPKAATGAVMALSLVMTEVGPCVAYHANEHWQALRCFDQRGNVTWQRDWEEGRLWLVPGSSKRVLLTTQGHIYDDTPRSLVLSAAAGAVEMDTNHASGAVLEAAAGKLRGLLGWEDEHIVLRAPEGVAWRLDYPWRGLVTAAPVGEDVVLLAHPMVAESVHALMLVRADAGGKEQWRTQVSLEETTRQEPNAIRLSIVGDRVVVLARGQTKTMATILSLADGKVLLSTH